MLSRTSHTIALGLALWMPVLCLAKPKPGTRPAPAVQRAPAKAASRPPRTAPTTTSASDSGDYVTEKRSDGSTVKYKKKTSYDFEGVGIDGIHNKPSGSYVSNIKDVKAKSIIRLRENFDAEVIDSSRQMK